MTGWRCGWVMGPRELVAACDAGRATPRRTSARSRSTPRLAAPDRPAAVHRRHAGRVPRAAAPRCPPGWRPTPRLRFPAPGGRVLPVRGRRRPAVALRRAHVGRLRARRLLDAAARRGDSRARPSTHRASCGCRSRRRWHGWRKGHAASARSSQSWRVRGVGGRRPMTLPAGFVDRLVAAVGAGPRPHGRRGARGGEHRRPQAGSAAPRGRRHAGQHGRGRGGAARLQRGAGAGRAARCRHGIQRRLRSHPRRSRAVDGPVHPHPRNRRGEPARDRRAERAHRDAAGGRRSARAVLSAGPGVTRRVRDWGKRRGVRGRTARVQVRHDAALRARDSRPCCRRARSSSPAARR